MRQTAPVRRLRTRWHESAHALQIIKFSQYHAYLASAKRGSVLWESEEMSQTNVDSANKAMVLHKRERLSSELLAAFAAKVKQPSGFLTNCSACKKNTMTKATGARLSSYIHEHSDAEFTHSICPLVRT